MKKGDKNPLVFSVTVSVRVADRQNFKETLSANILMGVMSQGEENGHGQSYV